MSAYTVGEGARPAATPGTGRPTTTLLPASRTMSTTRSSPTRSALSGRTAASSRRPAQDEVGGLERHVEFWTVADAVELDPVGLRQPLVPEAGGGRRPCD